MSTLNTKIDDAIRVIRKTLMKWPKVAVFVSFGKDSMVVLHLALQVDPSVKVITVMTKFKPEDTLKYKDHMSWMLNLNIDEYQSPVDVSPDLPTTDPDECCRILKVEPTKRALKNLDAWITGLRRTEGRTRTDYDTFEQSVTESDRLIVKVNPILDWTETDIWKYMALNNIMPHPWYAKGYRSLGCEPCTHIIDDKDTERAGRWQNTSKCGGECGIHTMYERVSP